MVRVTQSRLEPSEHEKGLFSYLLNAVSYSNGFTYSNNHCKICFNYKFALKTSTIFRL